MAVEEHPPRLAFWIHQVVEYLLGVLLISQAVQLERPVVPVLLGVLLVALAATADGPLAAFHVVPRPLHRVLDWVALGVIIVAAVVFRDDLETTGLVFAALAAACLLGLLLRTDYRPKRRRVPAEAPAPPVESEISSGERYGRAAGRALGKSIRSYRDKR